MLVDLLITFSICFAVAVTAGCLYLMFGKKTINKNEILKDIRIKRTIVPFDYTGKNYTEWMEYIAYMNDVNDVLQDRDTPINRELTARLAAENIFKINK